MSNFMLMAVALAAAATSGPAPIGLGLAHTPPSTLPAAGTPSPPGTPVGTASNLIPAGVNPRRVCIINLGTIVDGSVRGRVNNQVNVRNVRLTCR